MYGVVSRECHLTLKIAILEENLDRLALDKFVNTQLKYRVKYLDNKDKLSVT